MPTPPFPLTRAIHRLADMASRAESDEPLNEEALDVLAGTVDADRVALLLFDAGGALRFTAWRGLSPNFRAAADGYNPWPDSRQPALLAIPDVRRAALADTLAGTPAGTLADALTDTLANSLADALADEGVRAVAFVPLTAGSHLLGGVMIGFDQPHDFDPVELEAVQAVAAQVAFAIDRRNLENELRTANAALAATLEAVSDGITVQAPDGRLLFANSEAAAMSGYASAAELLAAGPRAAAERFDIRDEHGNPIAVDALPGRRALHGEIPPDRLIRYRTAGDDEDRWSLVTARPVHGDEGEVRFAVNVFRDVTDNQRAVEALHRSERRVAFLAASSRRLLDTTLDHHTVLDEVAELFVPALADLCSVREIGADGTFQRAAVRHTPSVAAAAAQLVAHPDHLTGPGVSSRIRRGEPVLVPDVADFPVEDLAADAVERELLSRLGARSAMVVRLLARDRMLGTITLLTAGPGDRYDEADLALAEEVGRRAGVAVETARVVEERTAVADTLQQALLPPALPDIPGVELAARYQPAASEVGGDFYDVVPLSPSRWMVAVGDVCGKGVEAASVSAMVRYTLRALAPTVASPSELLTLVNGALFEQLAPDRFCTIACGILDTSGGGARLTLSLGGHLRPLLVSPSGDVRPVGTPGTIIGILPEPALADETVELRPGDGLVVFTDGCVGEVPTGPDENRLLDVLRLEAGAPAHRLAEAIELAARCGPAPDDDRTVLACRRADGGESSSS